MEGIELADSLLYRDCGTSRHNNKYSSNGYDQVDIQQLLNGNYENDWNNKLIKGIYQGSNSCVYLDQNNVTSTSENECDISWLESRSFQNDLEVMDSKFKNNKFVEKECFSNMVYSSAYFRPISSNNSDELNDLDQYNINDKVDGYSSESHDAKLHKELLTREYSRGQDTCNIINIEEKELDSKVYKCNDDKSFNGVHGLCCEDQRSFIKNLEHNSESLSLDTLKIINNKIKTEASIINQNHQIAFNNTSLNIEQVSNINKMTSTINNNISSSINQGSASISSLFETYPISNIPTKTIGTTITIPQGSYIFIPFSVPNFSVNEIKHNNIKIPCKQLPPIILPKQSFSQSTPLAITDMSGSNESSSQSHSLYVTNVETITAKKSKKKTESAEFNYYFNIISESHKMLLKEKNKITMDKYILKDDILKNVINCATRNNNNMNKLETELSFLINSLFEINVLISKIESLRGISFIEPFYNILQNASDLIQSFKSKDIFPQYFTRNQNTTKNNEKVIEVQIEKLKMILRDIEEIRTFLWASYTNLSLDRERSLSCSLSKLKVWNEIKKDLRHSFKLNESKTQMSGSIASNGETSISYHDVSTNSSRPTLKFDRNSIAVQTQSFAIPVSQFPNHMTTIVQRFPNQQPPKLPHYNYIQTSISNFTHPTLLSNNNFPLGSNCRISYGSQQPMYTTPLNATHTNLSPRNYFIASSLMTPILYQNRSRQIINSTPINFMLYKTNAQII